MTLRELLLFADAAAVAGWPLASLLAPGLVGEAAGAAFAVHAWVSLTLGGFSRARRVVWPVMVIVSAVWSVSGYVLPTGQLSYWAATVLTNILSAIPFLGNWLVQWLWSPGPFGRVIGNLLVGLGRLNPFLLLAADCLLLQAVVRVRMAVLAGGMAMAVLCVLAARFLQRPDPLVTGLFTPARILPDWTFAPYFALLRTVPEKGVGLLVVTAAVLLWVPLPWLRTGPASGSRAEWRLLAAVCLAAVWVGLALAGRMPPDDAVILASRIGAALYGLAFAAAVLLGRPVKA